MTFYQQQINRIRDEVYPHDDLIDKVVHAKEFIKLHFAANIGLREIAGEAFYSKFHFIRIFKSCYGRTPYQYLTSVRIENAKKLLLNNISVTDTCFSVGFDSVTYFTGLFKKITGSTPALFQKKYYKPQFSRSIL
jgi:AraC-like DNA-binding protein